MKQLSLCMVTYNDEPYIADCLRELKEYVDEMIVADIGSSDQTVELAGRAGAEVYRFDWNHSFSDARNFCMDRAGGRWVLFLQAYESISAEHLKHLAALLINPNAEGYLVYYDNGTNERGVSSPNSKLRLIRNRKEYRFRYRAYEQMPDEQISNIENAFITIERRGGEPSWDAAMRARLLDEDIAGHPQDQYINYIYGIQLFNEGRHEESIAFFQKACIELNTDYLFAPHLYKCLGWSLLYLKRYQEALEVLNGGIDSFSFYTDLLALRGEVFNQIGSYKESIQDLKQCLNTMKQSVNMVPRPETNAAIVWEMLGIILEQLVNFRQALICFQEAYRLDYQNTELLSEICKLAVEEDLPEVLTDMLAIPVEQKMHDQIMILAEAFFTLGKYEKTLDCISLLKCADLPDPLSDMGFACRILLGKDENAWPQADGTIRDRFLLNRMQGLWLRGKMPEAESLLQEIDTTMGIAPSSKALYRCIQKAFCGEDQPFAELPPDEYKAVDLLHNTLLRNGQTAKAEALLPLLLDAKQPDHLIDLALSWTQHNDFQVLRQIFFTISETDKRAEYKRRILKKLLHFGHVETAGKLLELDHEQPSEEMKIAIWSARQIKKMEDLIGHMRGIGIITDTPGKRRKQGRTHKPLVRLFHSVNDGHGTENKGGKLTGAEIHRQLGMYFDKKQKRTEALSAYLRVLLWDPLDETAKQKVCGFSDEDPGLLDGLLPNIPWTVEGDQFCGKEEFINYVRGLISFHNEQYERAFAFFSAATETRCSASPAYLIGILCLWDREAEADALFRDSGNSPEIAACFCQIYRGHILHTLEEALTGYAYSGLLLEQKESIQNKATAFTA